jgi:hypothetical protein
LYKGLQVNFTESRKSSPAMLLQEAARLCRWGDISDWPDTLKIDELVLLQYPSRSNTAEDEQQALRKRQDFQKIIRRATSDGALQPETVQKTIIQKVQERVDDSEQGNISHGTPWDEHGNWKVPGFTLPVKVVEKTQEITVQVLLPDVVASWLESIEEKPSELVLVWIKATSKENGGNTAQKTKAPESKARVQERRILEIIRNLGHDPKNMPENLPGKPGVKVAVRNVALTETALFTNDTFDLAWKRLNKERCIVYAL